MAAFSEKVAPVSSGSGASGQEVRSDTVNAVPRMARTSAVLWVLWVARSSGVMVFA